MKKVLSLVLAGSMILSSMSMAFAATPATTALKDIAGNDYEEAIEALVALDVVSGYEDSTFRPAKTITRAELAKLLVEALGYGDLVAGARANFSDTQNHWSNGYVAIANGTGLVIGYPNGTFLPDQTVTYDEAYTMIVRALGYTDASIKGTWPTNFKVKAIDLGLTDDVKMATPAADRGGVAQALYNALEAVLVTVDADNKVTDVTNKDGDKVILLSKLATEDPSFDVEPDTVNPDKDAYAGNIVDLAPYMYQNLQVYLNDDDEVVYVVDSNSVVLEGKIKEVELDYITIEDSAKVEKDVNIVADSVTAYYNGVEKTTTFSSIDESIVKLIITDADSDEKFDDAEKVAKVVVDKATSEKQISNEYVSGRTTFDGISLPKDSKGEKVDLTKVTVTGEVDSISDIAEDSVVTVFEGRNNAGLLQKVTLAVSTDTVEGKVAKVSADGKTVTIGSTAYKASDNVKEVLTAAVLGETGTLYLNAEGKFYMFEKESAEDSDNYAIVVSKSEGVYDTFLDAVDKYAKIKLATKDNEEVVYSLANEYKLNGTTVENVDTVIPVDVSADDVVTFELDSAGRVKSLDVITLPVGKIIATDTKAFILASNVVIFDAATKEVITKADLADSITASAVYNDDAEIKLLYVTVGVEATTDGTYAVVTDVEVTKNSDDDTVLLVTAYVDGAKVTYLTDSDYYVNTIGTGKAYATVSLLRTAVRSAFKVVEFEMDGDVITDMTIRTDAITANVKSVKADNDVITLVNDDVIVLADDAVVYLQTGDYAVEVVDINAIDADSTATVDATEGDTIKYLPANEDGEVEVVVIQKR